jgi:mitogen-activated protein kinase kinase
MSSPPAPLGNPDARKESQDFGLKRAVSEHTGHDESHDARSAHRIPSHRSISDPPALSSMSSSSSPLGVLNNARRPTAGSTLSSGGLPQDMQAKMKAFHLSRQGTPPGGRPQPMSSASPGPMPDAPSSSLPVGTPGALRMSIRPPAGQGFSSAPSGTRPGQKPSLSQRRNMPKLGGLPGSPAALPSMNLNSDKNPTNGETGTIFDKFSKIVDTKNGTLRFEGKAILHGGGVDFSTGSNISISLDEVDTLEELGKGNYGTVYKVCHARPRHRRPGLGLAVTRSSTFSTNSPEDEPVESSPVPKGTAGIIMAMKEIRLELDEAKFAAIIMELDILHRCVSPYIIDFYGAFFQEGAVYICIEFMDGGSIDKLYGDGIPENVLRKITYATTCGLKELKDVHNIIHRDVKPTNILVNTRGQIKICDFGVSGNLVASIAKTNIGCQSYMAPERISGGGMSQGTNSSGTYSVQSDIWSLGLSIIECAMGQYPYPPETYSNIFSQLSVCIASFYSAFLILHSFCLHNS